MNPILQTLQPYPFQRLRALFSEVEANTAKSAISLSIGEPKHSPPKVVLNAVSDNLSGLAHYPATLGLPELRQTIANWLQRRFGLTSIDWSQQVLPVNGTREALFAFAQAVVRPNSQAMVLSPNPFYQIYEGAALLAGAGLYYLNCTADNEFVPEFDKVSDDIWERCQLLYLCTPGNPTGALLSLEQMQHLIRLSRDHDFIIASDECYSEIYFNEQAPPPGLLQASAAMGHSDFGNCVVFHSLSKRSNLPGLRSGFVAGDAAILERFALYRTYHGCAMPLHHQLASIAAWEDETHVVANRKLYREKFASVLKILQPAMDVAAPDAGFYLWPRLASSDTQFAQTLYATQNVSVLPGSFLAREADGINPGANRLRLALVAEPALCVEAAERIVSCLNSL
ncbi:MAG: succinyldiaminopimelate transaminase [Pseudomonadota bacterium]